MIKQTTQKHSRYVGGHVSCAGGIPTSIGRAVGIGANCLQIFSASPRTWAKKPLEELPIDEFLIAHKEANMGPTFTHAVYLVNFASESRAARKKSVDTLIYDLQFDAAIGGSGVVVHLGSHQGRGWEAVRTQVAQEITTILENTPEHSTFLIENSAGQKGKLSSDLSEIRWLLDAVASPRLGWCLDTCHAFAAGYSFGSEDIPPDNIGKNEPRGDLFTQLETYDLFSTLQCIHVNDSKDLFASGRDRHQNIGEGSIPKEWFETLLQRPELKSMSLITEAPGFDGKGPDRENIERIRNLVG